MARWSWGTRIHLPLSPFLSPPLPPLPLAASISECIFNMLIVASESCFATSGFKQFHININDPGQPRRITFLVFFFSSGIYAEVPDFYLFWCINEQIHHVCFAPWSVLHGFFFSVIVMHGLSN